MSLKHKSAKGVFWSGVDSVGANILRITLSIILARLLDVSDFGLVALLGVFISLSETIMQGGFSQALIANRNVSKEDYSTAFVYNLSFSLFAVLIIFVFSKTIASFFEQPLLESMAKVLPFVVVIHALGFVQKVSLRRALNFKALSLINITTTAASGAVAVFMAFNGYGVWSLVFQLILKAILSTILLWVFGRWTFSLKFSKASFLKTFGFGYKVVLANILSSASNSLYNIIIGRAYTVTDLGYFHQARKLSDSLYGLIGKTVYSVSFPALASINEQRLKQQKAYVTFLGATAVVSFPIMTLFIVIARPVFFLFLTEKWAESIPYFQLLCFSGMFVPLIIIAGQTTLLKGRSDMYLKLELLQKAMLVFALLITTQLGIKAMVIGLVAQVVIYFLVTIVAASMMLDITVGKQLLCLKNAFIASLVSAAIVYIIGLLVRSDYLTLVMQSVLYLLVYISILHSWRAEELMLAKELVFDKIKNKALFKRRRI